MGAAQKFALTLLISIPLFASSIADEQLLIEYQPCSDFVAEAPGPDIMPSPLMLRRGEYSTQGANPWDELSRDRFARVWNSVSQNPAGSRYVRLLAKWARRLRRDYAAEKYNGVDIGKIFVAAVSNSASDSAGLVSHAKLMLAEAAFHQLPSLRNLVGETTGEQRFLALSRGMADVESTLKGRSDPLKKILGELTSFSAVEGEVDSLMGTQDFSWTVQHEQIYNAHAAKMNEAEVTVRLIKTGETKNSPYLYLDLRAFDLEAASLRDLFLTTVTINGELVGAAIRISPKTASAMLEDLAVIRNGRMN